MERRLTSLHHAGSKAGFSRYVLVISVAAAIIVILPCIHLGISLFDYFAINPLTVGVAYIRVFIFY